MTDVEAEKAVVPATVPMIVRDPYGIATTAAERLARDVTDEEARSAYGQALARLKLLDAARRSMVPWTSRARRFAANLRALEEQTPAGAALVRAAASDLSRYELHLAADGNFQILDTTAPIWKGWLGGLRGQLTQHKATEQLWQYDPQSNPLPPPMVFDSIGFGWLFLHALRTTEQAFLNYRCAVYVLERDPLMLAMAMHLHDMQEVIRSSRVRWFIGATDEETLSALRTGLTENTSWTLPQLYVRSNLRPRTRLGIEETINEISSMRQKQREAWIAEAKAYYDGKDAAFWQARFSAVIDGKAGAQPLRVLGLTSRYTTVLKYSMAEMQEAVGQWTTPAGGRAEMRTAIEPDDQSTENPFLETIATFKPDLIFQISRMRYENELLPRNVPFLCWDQDNLPCMRTSEATASLNELTYVAGSGATYGYDVLHWPRRNVLLCHAACSTFRYHARPADTELLKKIDCDISFVSNASGSPESLRDSLAGRWAREPVEQRLFLAVSDRIITRAVTGETWEADQVEALVRSVADEHAVRLSPASGREMNMAILTLGDRCFRHAALQWVAQWATTHKKTFRLYGAGWESHPMFAPYAAGTAQPGEHLRAIYQASRINLQLMQHGFIHSRALDGLAVGAFFLTRRAFNDGDPLGVAAAHYHLAKRAEQLGLRTVGDLSSCHDPQLAKAWAVVSRWYKDAPPTKELRAMDIWAAMPGASIVFSDYEKIVFTDEASFVRLADNYLANDAARREIADRMRDQARADFSYARRWEQFLAGVHGGLATQEATPHA